MDMNYSTITDAELGNKCIIIKIKKETVRKTGSIYEAVRHCWHDNKYKAEQRDYVVAVIKGVVKGVFEPTKWYRVDEEECKKINCGYNKGPLPCGRIAFIGKEADNDIKNMYLDKYIPCKYRKQGMANPFLYTFQ